MTNQAARDSVLHYMAPLTAGLAGPDVIEVCVNRPGEMYVETRVGWRCVEAPACTDVWGRGFAATVATWSAQVVSEAMPVLSATLPAGERVQIVVPPATAAGTMSVTIRKPSSVSMRLSGLSSGGLFTQTRAAADREGTAGLVELYRAGTVGAVSASCGEGAAKHSDCGCDGVWQDDPEQGVDRGDSAG